MDAILDEVLVEQQETLRTTMRSNFPFLKDSALDRILNGANDLIRQGVHQEAPAMEENKTRFDFFSLPAELRNNIYEDVIDSPGCIQSLEVDHWLSERSGGVARYGQWIRGPPPITQVCRRLRQETLPVFLGRRISAYVDVNINLDVCSCTPQLDAWLRNIGPQSAGLIKDLTVYMPLPQDECTWKVDCHHDQKECGGWRPNSSEEVCTYLGLDQLGIKPSAVRGLFGVHTTDGYYDWTSEYTRKGDVWKEAISSRQLEKLWWTPVVGEDPRDGDNGIWKADEQMRWAGCVGLITETMRDDWYDRRP